MEGENKDNELEDENEEEEDVVNLRRKRNIQPKQATVRDIASSKLHVEVVQIYFPRR